MIRKLSCRNFKSWREPESIGLAPLTVFFGGNATGKSSLLQILALLKQTAESPDRAQAIELGDRGSLVDAGAFENLVWGRDPSRAFELGVEWQLPFFLHVNDPKRTQSSLFNGNTLELATTIGWSGGSERKRGRAVVSRMVYRFAGSELGMQRVDAESSGYELFHTYRDLKLRRKTGASALLPAPVHCFGFPSEATSAYENLGFVRDFETQLEQRLAQVFFLGAHREPPPRRCSWAGARPAGVGRHGEQVVEALLAAREAGQTLPAGRGRQRQSVEERVVERLRALGLIEGLEIRKAPSGGKHFETWVRRSAGGCEVPLADAGDGIAQILPIITLCYYAPEGATLLLEKPETALDPAGQIALAEILVEVALGRGVQLVVESQSEHLLRRLQRRIAEDRLRPRQVALYVCSNEAGESKLSKLKLDRYGAVESWPAGLPDNSFEEITAITRAALARRTPLAG